MLAAGWGRRDCLAVTAGSSYPSMMRANVPATGGQILPGLTPAVCGYLQYVLAECMSGRAQVLYPVKGTARNERRCRPRGEGIMHPTFVTLFMEASADTRPARHGPSPREHQPV